MKNFFIKLKNYFKREWLFYLTGFFSGMSVMAIELGAQRLLSPYFSSSQIIWTIVIGVIMIAMAIGNIIGGKMADKYQKPDKLFIMLFIAATWIILIPLVGKFIIAGIALGLATFITHGYLIWASLISCLVVFVFPLLVLGMVTPNIVKFATKNLESNGNVIGKIEAFNTIGSIIGTFIPTFLTIPFIGTAATFLIFSIILYTICMVYLCLRSKYVIRTSIISVIAIGLGIFSTQIKVAFWNSAIIYEGESQYNYLRIEDNDTERIFSTNVLFGVQSVKMKEKGLTGYYYDYAMASAIMAGVYDKKIDVLILGLGTGTYAYQCIDFFGEENLNIDGVEIDGKIVDVAKKYFELPECVNVYVEDGRAYLNNTDKKYDLIMVDAYRDISVPFQMSSKEFFKLVKDHLNENGNMVLNMNMFDDSKGSINDYLKGTVRSVFSDVYTCETTSTNLELFAGNSNIRKALNDNISKIDRSDLRFMMEEVEENLVKVDESKYILTDDKAPVERLGMRGLDKMISEELLYLREEMKGKSIPEIIALLW